MTDVLLTLAFVLTGICGYWIMARVDRFLNEYTKETERESDEQQ